MCQCQIRYLTTLLQIHSLQIFAVLRTEKEKKANEKVFREKTLVRQQKNKLFRLPYLSQRLEANVGKLMTSGAFQRTEIVVVVGESEQRGISQIGTFADAKLSQIRTSHRHIPDR